MKTLLPVLLCAAILLCLLHTSTAGQPATPWPAVTKECRPWTYWWWMGSAVDDRNLTHELERYHAAGLGGVHIVPIYGVKGQERRCIEYLSPAWMARLRHATGEAARLGMGLDMTTGTGWNFGGPSVTEHDADATVVHKVYPLSGGRGLEIVFDRASPQALVAYGDDGRIVELTDRIASDGKVDWTAPPGSWKVHHVCQRFSGRMVKRAAPGGEGRMINPFSRKAMTDYLVRFDRALAGYDGPMPRAMYYDSYEYGSNWSAELFAQFAKRRGYRLQTQLPALFGEGPADTVARVKCDYRQTVSEMIEELSLSQWARWSRAKGMQTRLQAHGSPGNILDLYAVADIPETEMFNRDRDPLIAKFASSSAHVSGRRLVAAETGTWLAEHFHATLSDMKKLVDEMFLGGVNHVIYHGTCYSPDDAPWPGWVFYASTQMNPRNAIWRDAPTLNEYIARIQSILQTSNPDNDVLVYWPISDAWHDAMGMLQHAGVSDVDWFYGHSIGQLAKTLWDRGYAFDYVSDRQIARAVVKDGAIRLGSGTYRVLLVPACQRMPEETLRHLFRLASGGVPVICQSHMPSDVPGLADLARRRVELNELLGTLRETPTANPSVRQALVGKGRFLIGDALPGLDLAGVQRETLVDHPGAQFVRLARSDGHDYLVVNHGTLAMQKWVSLAAPARSILLMDPLTGDTGVAAVRRSGSRRSEVLLQLSEGQSIVLRSFADREATGPRWRYVRPAGKPVDLTGTWQVEFIEGGPTLPAPLATAALRSWTELGGADARRFAGTARYRITFDAPAAKADAWIIDLGNVASSARVRLNGRLLGTLITSPYRVALRDLKPTGNVLEVEVTSLSANRIRDLDRRGVPWKIFRDINMVGRNYRPLDASAWPVEEAGLLGPVQLWPVAPDRPDDAAGG